MEAMKGITCCGDCIHYNWKKHKCNLGCKDEGLATDHFYKDCPLPKVQPVNQWIPCSERLPDEGQKVLIQYVDRKDKEDITMAVGWTEFGCLCSWDDRVSCVDDCVAWMPLPEAYKEGE